MPTIEDLCAEILRKQEEAYKDAATVYPQHVPRASSIGDCDREMVLSMTNWQLRPPPEPGLMAIFERGKVIEKVVLKQLSDLEFDVTLSQMASEIRDRDGTLLCTLHIDGRIEWQGICPVFECKSLNQYTWASIDTAEDLAASKTAWARKYPRQLLLYMYAHDEPNGLFLCDDKSGHWKVIPMRLEDHLDTVETLLQRLRSVVDHKAAGTLPAFIDNPLICKACWCCKAGICLPPMDWSAGGIHIIDDMELALHFATVFDYEDEASEYGVAERAIKEHFKARGPGDYLVGSVEVHVKRQKNGIRTTWRIVGQSDDDGAARSERWRSAGSNGSVA
jgi:hypothetical protein